MVWLSFRLPSVLLVTEPIKAGTGVACVSAGLVINTDNYTGIVVHDANGTAVTSQPVTEFDGVKTVGKIQ